MVTGSFDELLASTSQPILVDFWADWCGPCHAVAPTIEQIARDYRGRALVIKVNVDNFAMVILQILVLDIVFSLDSVITAVGMAKDIWVMVAAVVLAVGVMLIFSGRVSAFVERHPTVKMLALAFLLLIGTTLIAEGFGQKIPKGYIYAAMTFSVFVEVLNIGIRRKAHIKPLHLREPIVAAKDQSPN